MSWVSDFNDNTDYDNNNDNDHGWVLVRNPHIPHDSFEDVEDNTSVDTGNYAVYDSFSYDEDEILRAVVLIALWDKTHNRIVRSGTGFIADKKRCLIITASHILFDLTSDQRKINDEFFGIGGATAIIGVYQQELRSAVFTYCADIVASDVYNVDGCVLQIKSKFVRPIEVVCNYVPVRAELPISARIKQERLKRLVMTTSYKKEQEIRLISFQQTGENVSIEGGGAINCEPHVNRGFLFSALEIFVNPSEDEFVPRSEIIISCSTGSGCGGGPLINKVGEVIGILSRTDPVETERCYLTSAKELKILLRKAKKKCDRTGGYLSPNPSTFSEDLF